MALKIISGDVKPPEEKPENKNDPEDDQIDTCPKSGLMPTLDVLDPVFAKALSAPSIQSIKD